MMTSLHGLSPRRLIAALLTALLVASCGGGGGGGGEVAATTVAAAPDAAAKEAAARIASGGREQALAVDAALTFQVRSAGAERIRQVIVFGDSLSDVGTYKVGPIAEVQSDAAIRYFYADDVHPTTLGHLIIARFVLTEMWRQRLL